MMVDIIVRARDGRELTSACIASIRANTPESSYRVVLVEDGGSPYYGAEPDVRMRYSPGRGAVTATNVGLAYCLGTDSEYVCILDNDTRIPDGDSGWLERFVAALEEGGPRCGCVGATTGFANPPQHILAAPATYTGEWKDGQRAGGKENPDSVWFVSFACLLRKAAILDCGLWDHRFDPGNWEDTDYSVQLRTKGWSIKVAQSVYIHHEGHKTFSDGLRQLLQTNGQKMAAKWGAGRLVDLGILSPQQLQVQR